MALFNTLRFIVGHPLNANARRAALIRWLRWQLGSRLLPGEVVCPFVNDACLVVRPGMTGATGNVYVGLHEFEDMAFLLHYLRPEDLFVDVGANVGSYTVLAGGGIGAACLSIEPLPQAFAALRRNIAVNEMGGRVQALNLGLASQPGVLRFTSRLDTVNHVLSKEEDHADAVEVPVRTLDEVVGDASPALLKMDVEGYETEVLAGAQRVLANPALRALILELNGSGRRYGFDEDAIRRQLRDLGFIACSYHPFERALTPRAETAVGGNTLFARDLEYVENCLRTAPAFRLLGREI
ncbi:Methyltransferase FkbM family [Methylococcus capsulatus]|uniref:Methyltransferase FkbM family n=1 Tax=Methylococcus capsulatus TaxID=414 RepID=A0AA35UWQ7_METCP|nr:FkbM family methyltransferase [Methylococcus capsulatus]CAI8722954.1 Methyltransferase FkbM family [Methylococcus capsulatus]